MSLTKATYSMINGATLNVLDYGADDTGSADSSPAFQAAVDALPSTGGTITVPIGTYKLQSEILISGKTGVRILGASKNNSVLVKSYSSGGPLIHFLNANYWALDFLFIQGSSDTSGTDPLVYVEGSSYGRLTMCKVFNGRGPGVKIEQGTGTNGSYFNTIQDNHFFNNGVGDGINGSNIFCGSESSETKVIGGECQSSPGAGWRIDGGNGHAGLGASFEGNTNYGVKIGTVSVACEVFLFGCRFEGAGIMQYGVHITNALTQVSLYGCHLTSNVVGDVYDPDAARVSWAGCNTSSSPLTWRAGGVKQDANGGLTLLNLANGFLSVVNASGVAEISGSSSTRLTTDTNGLELGSANGVLYLNSPVTTINFQSVSDLVWRVGSGTPEGNVTAAVGSLYTRTNGGAGTTLYVKESGAGNTGWVAK